MAEQLPVPCARCGAPMEPVSLTEVACRFCGARDTLPADASARAALLHARWTELRLRRQALEGMDASVSRVIESGVWLKGTLKAAVVPFLLVIVTCVILPIQAYSARTGPATEATVRAIVTPVSVVVAMLATVGGMVLAYTLVARRYMRRIRPRILARAPRQPGAPARCRVCGGDLPPGHGAWIECHYCHAMNLVTPEIARDRARLLEAETREYELRARGAAVLLAEHVRLMSGGILLGNVAGIAIAMLVVLPLLYVAVSWALGVPIIP